MLSSEEYENLYQQMTMKDNREVRMFAFYIFRTLPQNAFDDNYINLCKKMYKWYHGDKPLDTNNYIQYFDGKDMNDCSIREYWIIKLYAHYR
jgi:hypothetical protein